MHRQAKPEVRVVIEVRSRRDDPVDEAGFDERDQSRHAETGWSESSRDGESDGDVRLQHFLREQLTRLAQAGRVIGEERALDQLGDSLLAVDPARIDAL